MICPGCDLAMSQEFSAFVCPTCDSEFDWDIEDEPGSLFDVVDESDDQEEDE